MNVYCNSKMCRNNISGICGKEKLHFSLDKLESNVNRLRCNEFEFRK